MGKGRFDRVDKKKGFPKFLIVLAVVLIVCIGLVLYTKNKNSQKKDEGGKVTTVTQSELMDVIKKSDLYTAEYPYNSYTVATGTDGKPDYYVAYKGTVKAGFDVNDVQVQVNNDQNLIVITLPEISVKEINVDPDIETIDMRKHGSQETEAEEAYNLAVADLKKKASDNPDILSAATDNAKMVEKQLVEPWVNQVDSSHQYTVEVRTMEGR